MAFTAFSTEFKQISTPVSFADQSSTQSKNLIHFNDNIVLVWHRSDQSVYCFRLEDQTNITNVKCLNLTNAPLFDVDSLHLNGTGRYLGLCGRRGCNIVELPIKLDVNGFFTGKEPSVLSRSWALGQRFFVCNQDIELLCSDWHPNCPQQQHIVLLTNDNCLRLFDINEEETPLQIINVSVANPNVSAIHIGVNKYAASLGESAVSFDFGPSISKCYDIEPSTVTSPDECLSPIYVLRGNGDVLLVYSSLKYSYVSNTVFGPLTMRPPAEDNYGVDACSIICLDCVPTVLVIATSFGVLHHCIALDCEDESDSNRSLLPQPTLFVYESIELSLSLNTNSDEQDMTCALRLHKDQMIPMRYFCSHACGLHAIAVPFVSQLKSKEGSHFTEEESIVDHLICTQPVAATDSEQPLIPLGVSIGVQNGYTFILVLLSSGELITRRLTPSYITYFVDDENDSTESDPMSDISLPKVDFIEYIKQLLKRNTSVPLLKSNTESSADEWSQKFQLLISATNILDTEYIKKFELTSNAIDKRVKVLANDKQIQFKELEKCLTEKDTLLNDLMALINKYDETRERQEILSNRIDKLLEILQFQRPELSDAELKLKDELKQLSKRVTDHKNKLEQIKVKCKYQSENTQQMEDSLSGDQTGRQIDTSRVQTTVSTPTPNQIKSIKQMLANQSEQIGQLVQTLNTFNTTNGCE